MYPCNVPTPFSEPLQKINMSTLTLNKKALALPAKRRAALASRLLASLDSAQVEPHAKAWAEEVENRIDAFDSATTKAVPAAQVLVYRGKVRK